MPGPPPSLPAGAPPAGRPAPAARRPAPGGRGGRAPAAAAAGALSLRVARPGEAVDFLDSWERLREELRVVLTARQAQVDGLSSRRHYHIVYRLCTCACTNLPPSQFAWKECEGSPAPQVLHFELKRLLNEHAGTVLREVRPESRADSAQWNRTGVALLKWYDEKWVRYRSGVEYVASVCHYMSREYIQRKIAEVKLQGQDRPVPTDTKMMGFVVWRDVVYMPLARTLVQAALEQIEQDRRVLLGGSTPVDRALLKRVLGSIVVLGSDQRKPTQLYSEAFDARFCRATEQHYKKEMAEHADRSSLSIYMAHVETRIEEELLRARECFDPGTERVLLRTLIKVAVEERVGVLLDAAPGILAEGSPDDQARLFRLLKKTEASGGLEPLRKLVEDRIDQDGKAAVERVRADIGGQPLNTVTYVDALLSVVHRHQEIVRVVFESHDLFVLALGVGCARFVNRNALSPSSGQKSAQLIAKFVHLLLKPTTQTNRQRTEEEVEQSLSHAAGLVRHLEDKDVFQASYSTLLSRRLMQNTYNEHQELEMITRLKEVCGHEFTYKLQRMFTDVGLSRDLSRDFGEWLQKSSLPTTPELTTHVVTSGTWPLMAPQRGEALILPAPLADCRARFVQWYKGQHTGRKLTWLMQHSTAILRTHYPLAKGRSYELHMTVYQCAVLLCFNDPAGASTLAWDRVAEDTKLHDDDLSSTVQSLCRIKLLTSSEGAAAADDDDPPPRGELTLNADFFSAQRKVMLTQQQQPTREAPEDAATLKAVCDDRRFTIQAAIVRVMKEQKRLSHQVLIAEVTQQLAPKFQARPHDIKTNIDRLIEKEHMERCSSDSKSYAYLA